MRYWNNVFIRICQSEQEPTPIGDSQRKNMTYQQKTHQMEKYLGISIDEMVNFTVYFKKSSKKAFGV